MNKKIRKPIKIDEEAYEILKDYGQSKSISMSESVKEMSRDIDLLKAHELNTISENAKMFCDQVDSLAEVGRLPSWLVDAIHITIRPIIMQAMINKKEIDFAGLRASWKVPESMRLITCFDME